MTRNPFSDFSSDPRPIGVFDSGIGGLTVLQSLMQSMPEEKFLYLGDTARVPYGTKSADTICAYSTGLANVLMHHDVKMIVIACNTASAHATGIVSAQVDPIPVIGMIAPAAQAAIAATKNKNILVMGTQSTVRSGCYTVALKAMNPDVAVHGVPCQLLVALAEEGWTTGTIAQDIVERYIGSFFAKGISDKPDTIILGCTHFPLLRQVVADIAGPDVTLIDNGEAAARLIGRMVKPSTAGHALRFMVTDSVDRFTIQAEKFLGRVITPEMIAHIDLTSYDSPIIMKSSGKERKHV